MTKKKTSTVTEPYEEEVHEAEPAVTEPDSMGADDKPRPKKDRVWSSHQMKSVRVGDKVREEGAGTFIVAGIRLSPDQMPHNARVRLFDSDGTLRLEADPNYVVECER